MLLTADLRLTTRLIIPALLPTARLPTTRLTTSLLAAVVLAVVTGIIMRRTMLLRRRRGFSRRWRRGGSSSRLQWLTRWRPLRRTRGRCQRMQLRQLSLQLSLQLLQPQQRLHQRSSCSRRPWRCPRMRRPSPRRRRRPLTGTSLFT